MNVKDGFNHLWMEKAFSLAQRGCNRVNPNPRVGAVVVKNGKIIGQGWHEYFGGPHAEVNALKKAQGKAKGADLFVTLEPCSTHGKTPPCICSIAEAGIKRVFFGAVDINPLNRKKAVPEFKKLGIQAVYLQDYQRLHDEMNRDFIHGFSHSFPYIELKTAVTLDGKMADSKGRSKWISNESSRQMVHEIRQNADGILIGAATFNRDDPSLTIRPPFQEGTKDPAKIILTKSGCLNTSHRLLSKDSQGKVLILTTAQGEKKLKNRIRNSRCEIMAIPQDNGLLSLMACLKVLKKTGVHHLLVEGGAHVFSQFIRQRLFQVLHLFMAPTLFGGKDYIFSGDEILSSIRTKRYLQCTSCLIVGNTNELKDIYMRYSCLPGS
ncbi:MAG: bifunctional diaminohydroxyphosphoribosylaminopyrimidine deaminase/5-amino-6-(5-phosphoribosylamino)uracil reductase RibD [Candidatus Aureabacteria bacterium]|nr:bifunctional diaminohydroxyphosphoribosylaminopyrimidine deaminase/5-amino-6-(5-phosphoribosylamino)uracil reductase RibD [Candidatus Auribacterota bacterium]